MHGWTVPGYQVDCSCSRNALSKVAKNGSKLVPVWAAVLGGIDAGVGVVAAVEAASAAAGEDGAGGHARWRGGGGGEGGEGLAASLAGLDALEP